MPPIFFLQQFYEYDLHHVIHHAMLILHNIHHSLYFFYVHNDYISHYIYLLYLILRHKLVDTIHEDQNKINIKFDHIFCLDYLHLKLHLRVLLYHCLIIFRNILHLLYISSNVHVIFLFIYNLTYIFHFLHYHLY